MIEEAFLKDSITNFFGEDGEKAPLNSPSDFGLSAVDAALSAVFGVVDAVLSVAVSLLQSLLGG
ncbi:MAG TPA: hypothetical protein VMP10_03385 [Chloroflexota bacterium]|nr:hypothetical protein [Chloroflexota bacterium]